MEEDWINLYLRGNLSQLGLQFLDHAQTLLGLLMNLGFVLKFPLEVQLMNSDHHVSGRRCYTICIHLQQIIARSLISNSLFFYITVWFLAATVIFRGQQITTMYTDITIKICFSGMAAVSWEEQNNLEPLQLTSSPHLPDVQGDPEI